MRPGDNTRFSCKSGYTLDGQKSLLCKDSGNWSAAAPVCKVTLCGKPPNISKGYPVEPERVHQFNQRAKYACDTGYKISSSIQTLNCMSSGRWSLYKPSCNKVRCQSLPLIRNGKKHGNDFYYGSVVSYACNKGFALSSSHAVLQCTATGDWNGTTPKCISTECPELDRINNGKIELSDSNINATAIYRCDDGFLLKGAFLRLCLPNITWEAVAPVCEQIRCVAPKPVKYGTVNGDEYYYGHYANYTCNPGYILLGQPDIRCGGNGTWINPAPICAPVRCLEPVTMENGNTIGRSFLVNDTIKFVCNAGYNLKGISSSVCLMNGTWSGDPRSCEMITCEEPLLIPNGESSWSSLKPGSVVNYVCNSGYEIKEKATRTCRSDGTWTGPAPTCTLLQCLYPEQIRHGQFIAHDNKFGSNIEYQCDQGYELIGEENRTCGAYKDWSGSSPECMQMKCAPPRPIAHGKHVGVNFTVGAVIKYKCEPGYQIISESELTCTENKTWSGMEPKCAPIECETPLHVIPNGKMIDRNFSYNMTIRYTCDSGFVTRDTMRRTCQADGSWRNPVPSCHKVRCPIPERITNSHFNGSDYHFGGVIQYSCLDGYDMVGIAIRTCLANGSWSEVHPNCVPVSCQKLLAPDNAKVTFTGLSFKDVAKYQCDSRYELHGEDNRTCIANGTWSSRQPTCAAIMCPTPPSLTNGEVLVKKVRAGDLVQYLCNPGFILVQAKDLECTAKGKYTGDQPKCVRVQCNPPLKIRNGKMTVDGTSFGDRVRYYCIAGYILNGEADMVCDVRGKWPGSLPRCVPVTCPILSSIKHGWHTKYVRYIYGANITYHCNIGYQIVGDTYVVCRADRTWSSLGPVCEPKQCPVPNIPSSEISVKSSQSETVDNYLYGMTIQVKCAEGFDLSGVTELRCLSTGRWSFSMPECIPIACPEPTISNGVIEAPDGYLYNNIISISCIEGYVLNGNPELICQSNGKWSNAVTKCVTATCDTPYIINGEFRILKSPNRGFGYPYGLVLQFSCDQGYFLQGSETLTCESSAKWSDEYPLCQDVFCDSPVFNIDHAPVISPQRDQYAYGETVTFKCERGYRLHGRQSMFCTQEGLWNGTLPTCTLIECPHVNVSHSQMQRMINNSYIVPTSSSRFVQGMTLIIQCDVGFNLSGNRNIVCMENGTWSHSPPICQPVYCQKPSLNNGYASLPRGDTARYNVGSTAVLHCNRGYTMATNYKMNCLPNGTWSEVKVACSMITCDAPEIDAATVISKRQNGLTHFTVDDHIKVICITGYILIGSKDRFTCTVEGVWDNQMPKCHKLRCTPPEIEHSQILLNDQVASQESIYEFGDVITVKCDDGYFSNDTYHTELKCTSKETWSDYLPSCHPIRCPSLFVEHGLVIADDNIYGSVVNIECKIGYDLFGDHELTCKGQGKWSGLVPICAMIECQKPNVTNGLVLGNRNLTYNFGSIISFQCDEGYSLDGQGVSLCMPDSTWSENPPTCQLVTCKHPPIDVENGHIQIIKPDLDENFSYGAVIQYNCTLGYRVMGPNEILCGSNGQWTSDFSVCLQNICRFPLITNGYADGRASGNKGDFIFRDTVKFKCRPGFDRVGAPEMFCDPYGNWTESFPGCVRVSCAEPPKLSNGIMTGDAFKFGDTVTYSCWEGFELVGSAEVRCLATKSWGLLPTCNMILCQLPPDIQYGMFLATGLRYGDKIRYACNGGYALVGEMEHTCQADRSWSGTIPTCTPVECVDPIPPLLNGKLMVHHQMMKDIVYVYNDKVHYDCMEGHTKNGPGFITCTASGTWSELSTTCTVVVCDKPVSVDNGRLVEGKHTFGSMVEYRCDHGYNLLGYDQLWCMATGRWNATVPTCHSVPCDYPAIPEHGALRTTLVKLHKPKDFTALVPSGFHFADQVDYSCEKGYRLNGQSKLECSGNGSWSAVAPDCSRLQCVLAPHFPNGNINGSTGFYRDQLAVTCNKGFEIRGDNYIECTANQNWAVHRVECALIVCTAPPAIENGHAIGGPYVYNSTIEYRCDEGQELADGDVSLTCMETRQWSGTAPRCSPVMCSHPSPILYGYYMVDAGTTLHFGVTITFGCDEGYELHGSDGATCLANSKWSEISPKCQPIHCPDPDPIESGQILGSLNHAYNDMVQYSCEIGYNINGEAFRTCTANGTWTGDEPVCEMVTCSLPSYIDNGMARGRHNIYGSVVLYSCDEMYDLMGQERRICESNGMWSGGRPSCKLKTCITPPVLSHGDIEGSDYSAGLTLVYTCLEGYYLSGGPNITCMGDGWSDEYPECRKIQCGEPPIVEHSVTKGDGYHYMDRVVYKCLEGHVSNGKDTITCQENGTWSDTQITCEPVSCGEPPILNNSFNKPEGLLYGDIVIFGCDEGYEMFGSNLLECVADGTWVGTLPVCKMISCGVVLVIPHASVIVSRNTYTSIARYICNRGYVINGSDHVECMANGTWMYKEKPSCIPVDCGRPVQLLNGGMKLPDTTLGNVATFYCLEGYALHGNSQIQCGFDATWNSSSPECHPVECPLPTAPQNGLVIGEAFVFGSDVMYSCVPGYQLVGDVIRTCMPDGDWGHNEPRCDCKLKENSYIHVYIHKCQIYIQTPDIYLVPLFNILPSIVF